ncbi:MAG: tetratricopeptide repeat protein, partial [Chloroflexi bacterium]|nr:tetratricopeptide repeat protein [Chloroflexota bacterium]
MTTLLLSLTTFIGRRREIAEVQHLLESTRLLTLTGAGGAGKTRLALTVANTLVPHYSDGIWFVPLEALTDPARVASQLVTALGVREEVGQPLSETICSYLRPRTALIVFDNCEHLALACGVLAEALLHACPGLHILATSRQPLGIAGETTWRVPSLALPNPTRRPPIERFRQVESVQLFAERAAAVLPGFTVTERNAAAVAEVCQRLDGIPLALELAAARVRVLAVDQIAARLDDRFRLLTGGSPTALPRQQTLLNTLDWSHDGLSAAGQRLLRWLSVFAGGWTLDAAEAVCAGNDQSSADVLEVLTELVDKSLVARADAADETVRYRLLETVRQYARDKLSAANEEAVARTQHADWILSLVERLGPSMTGPQQGQVLEQVSPELDNLRTALDWVVSDAALAAAGLRACAAAYRIWLVRGFLDEGRRRLEQFARTATDPSLDACRAYTFFTAGTLAMFQGDFAGARTLVEESLARARAMDNNFQVGESLTVLALLMLNQGDATPAWAMLQADVALCRRRIARPEEDDGSTVDEFAQSVYGQSWPVMALAHALLIAGVGARIRGNQLRALEFYEESLHLSRQTGDTWFIAQALSNLGLVSLDQRDGTRARALFDEALALRRGLGDRTGIARSLNDLGGVAFAEGDLAAAHACYAEHLSLVRELGDRSGIADALVALGQV